jgi:hypothetical protein
MKMEAAGSSETSLRFYQTVRRHKPESNSLYKHRYDNLKFFI